MNKYYYDLHIHSCLSPCADDDNTPANIVGMAALSGLNIIALTDHNTTKNCPVFFKIAKAFGIIAVAGMELTTSEDIHVICLFERLEDAMNFGEEIEKHRIPIKNRPDIFGRQLIVDEDDNIVAEEENLLSNATDISVEDAPQLAERFGGICYPAHIDREANGIIAVLGALPEDNTFSAVEFHNAEAVEDYEKRFDINGKVKVISSDAHYLGDIKDKENFFSLEDEPYSSDFVRHQLFRLLRGEK